MNSYRIVPDPLRGGVACIRRDDGLNIPLDRKNRDFAQFVHDWEAGAEVQGTDGKAAAFSEAGIGALTPAGVE